MTLREKKMRRIKELRGIPKEILDNAYAIEIKKDGNVSIYLRSRNINEQSRDNSGKDDLQKH